MELTISPYSYHDLYLEDFFTTDELMIFKEISLRRDLYIDEDKILEYTEIVKNLEYRRELARLQLKHILENESHDLEQIKAELQSLLEDKFNGSVGIVNELADMMGISL